MRRRALFEIGLASEASGEVAADDEVVDVFDEVFDAGIDFVEVGDDGDACGAGPACGEGGGGGFVAIDVKGAGVDDPVAIEIGGLEEEALVAAAEDGALAAAINEDEGLRAGGIRDGDEAGVDAGADECAAMQRGGIVVAELADIAGGQAPCLAGDDGCGDLAAGQDVTRACTQFWSRAGGSWKRESGCQWRSALRRRGRPLTAPSYWLL